MKPQFVFYFADEPQFATQETRKHTANVLRHYRRNTARFVLTRLAPHHYQMRGRHYGAPVAIIEAQGAQSMSADITVAHSSEFDVAAAEGWYVCVINDDGPIAEDAKGPYATEREALRVLARTPKVRDEA